MALSAVAGTLLAGLASGGASLFTNAMNWMRQDKENETIREREDTAVQRRVADLKAVGLSPTLAAGSAATTTATSAPQSKGGEILDALSAAAQLQGIKNAREENANMRKSRDVMNADIALKYGELLQHNAQTNYFNAQANNAMIQGQVYSAQIAKYYQDIAESVERTKGYKYKAMSDSARAELDYWNRVRAGQEIDLINATGQSSSVGGLFNPLGRALGSAMAKGLFNGNANFNAASVRELLKW